jgi:phosphatidylglycerol:prolipoprotein diacylglycerol transferase
MLIHPMPTPSPCKWARSPIHWYGLMYVLAFALFIALGRVRIKQPHIAAQRWKKEDLDDMLFYGMLGVVIGGAWAKCCSTSRNTSANPIEIFKVWHGGMSFHGGFLGVLIAMSCGPQGRPQPARRVRLHRAAGAARLRGGPPRQLHQCRTAGPRGPDQSLPWAMLWPDIRYPLHPSPIYQMLRRRHC